MLLKILVSSLEYLEQSDLGASPSPMDVLCSSMALDRPDSGHPWSKLTADFSKPVIFFSKPDFKFCDGSNDEIINLKKSIINWKLIIYFSKLSKYRPPLPSPLAPAIIDSLLRDIFEIAQKS